LANPDHKSVDLSIHREQIADLPAKLHYCQIQAISAGFGNPAGAMKILVRAKKAIF
jgi:hypothetical protein